jgi:predicted HTH domain antitoxin
MDQPMSTLEFRQQELRKAIKAAKEARDTLRLAAELLAVEMRLLAQN